MVLSIDLNDVPAESRQVEESAPSTDPQPEHPPSHGGSGSVPPAIDADAIDDEVTMLTATEWYGKAWSHPRRRRSLRISIGENLETNTEHSGAAVEEPIATICPDCRNSESLMNWVTGGSVIYTRDDDVPTVMDDGKQPILEAEKEASDEPSLICPICLSALNEPSSTTCGHVFCSSCIEKAIEKQKKCPTCRKKLTKKNFHRIYLPSD